MKKLLMILGILTFTISMNAQIAERQIGGGSACNGYWDAVKLDCTAASGICCLGEVVVKPNTFTLLGTLLEEGKNDKIAEMAKRGLLGKAIQKYTLNSKALEELLAGLSNQTLILEKITFPPNSKVSKSASINILVKKLNKSKKHDYVGHVTLLR